MSITKERLLEIDSLLNEWLHKRAASKRDLQSIIGKLQFVGKCVRGSRVFISRLLQKLSTLKQQNHRFKLNSAFKKDLKWWKRFLYDFNGITIIPEIKWSKPDTVFATDACLSGGGGNCGKEFFHFKFPEFILDLDTHINYLELLVVLVAAKIWKDKFRDARVQIYCDNLVTVTVINSGKTKDSKMLELLRELAFVNISNNSQIRAIHIPGLLNRVPDRLSRLHCDKKLKLKDIVGEDWEEIVVEESDFRVTNDW
jgi:hypothetical protein